MNFDMKKPCHNCPFLKVGGIRLRKVRARDIAKNSLSDQGKTFTCHLTTVQSEVDDLDMVDGPNAAHCAGALIFSEKQGKVTQMMRIAERLGIYDPKPIMADKEVVGSVFDSLKEMVRVNWEYEQGENAR
jgi:hypothetical protein